MQAVVMDVYNKLERLVPVTDELVVPAQFGPKGSVRLRSKADLDTLPWFPWDDIYSFVGHEPVSDKAKKSAKRLF